MQLLLVYWWIIMLASFINSASTYRVERSTKLCSDSVTARMVETNYGIYVGKVVTFPQNEFGLCPVAQYLGIRYAILNGNGTRWKKPVPLTKSYVKENVMATQMGAICPQNLKRRNFDALLPEWFEDARDFMSTRLSTDMSEDCLFLNIYVPMEILDNETNDYKASLPVMVYFHGHTFLEGSGNFYDGSILATYGRVIVVTLNYRLGVLGFLSFLKGEARGNYGLWDQLEALRWIKENIAQFGGDPNSITAFGSGSGAVSINLLMLTYKADKLFHRAILQSGTALSSMAIVDDPVSQARFLAEQVNCIRPLTDEMMDCLLRKPWKDLVYAEYKPDSYKIPIGPVIDGDLFKSEPGDIMRKGEYLEYQIMVGVCQGDGYGYVKQNNFDGPTTPVNTKNDFLMAIDRFIDIFYNQVKSMDGLDVSNIMRRMIAFEYQDHETTLTPESAKHALLKLYTDHQWLRPVVETALLNSKLDQPTYLYTFGYRPGEKQGDPSWLSAAHGEEIPFVFGYPLLNKTDGIFPYNIFTDNDILVSAKDSLPDERKEPDSQTALIPDSPKSSVPTALWRPTASESIDKQSGPGSGGRKSESGMSLQLTITLAIGFVLIFVNIIAFSIVTYHKQKDKLKIQKLKAQLTEKLMVDDELRRRGIVKPSTPDEGVQEAVNARKAVEKPLGGAVASAADKPNEISTALPLRCLSNADTQLFDRCMVLNSSSSPANPVDNLKKHTIFDSSADASPTSIMASCGTDDFGRSDAVVKRSRTFARNRNSASLNGRLESHVPDYKFKTYNGRASFVDRAPGSETDVLGVVKKQTSLCSIASFAGAMYPRPGQYIATRHRARDSPTWRLLDNNRNSVEQSSSNIRRDRLTECNEAGIVVARAGCITDDTAKNGLANHAHASFEKSRVSSEISGSETDRAPSSSESDRACSYCVTNNKMNVITKL